MGAIRYIKNLKFQELRDVADQEKARANATHQHAEQTQEGTVVQNMGHMQGKVDQWAIQQELMKQNSMEASADAQAAQAVNAYNQQGGGLQEKQMAQVKKELGPLGTFMLEIKPDASGVTSQRGHATSLQGGDHHPTEHCDEHGCDDDYGGYWDEDHGGYWDEKGQYWEEGMKGYWDPQGQYYQDDDQDNDTASAWEAWFQKCGQIRMPASVIASRRAASEAYWSFDRCNGKGEGRPTLRDLACTDRGRQTACPIKFPMHVVPLDVFLSLRRLKPFQELYQEGKLVKFHAQMGNVIFVSHQWLKKMHPDPHFQQTRVLQEALVNLLSGRSRVAPQAGCSFAQNVRIQDLKAKPLYIWYDYMSCPQLVADRGDPAVLQSLHNAVESIPGYVQMSAFFFILAPPVQHMETGCLLSYASWKARGWCRLERAAHCLSLESMSAPVVVEGPELQYATHHVETLLQPVGAGEFRSEYDKEKAASLLRAMVTRKMDFYQDHGDLQRYRVMLNTRHLYLQNLPLENDSFNLGSPAGFLSGKASGRADLSSFMRWNDFDALEPCANTWPPLIAAALSGGASLVAELLNAEADVNYQVPESEPILNVAAGMSALHICSMLGNNRALKALIDGQADLSISDSHGKTALDRAHEMKNYDAVVHLLCTGDAEIRGHADTSATCCAMARQSILGSPQPCYPCEPRWLKHGHDLQTQSRREWLRRRVGGRNSRVILLSWETPRRVTCGIDHCGLHLVEQQTRTLQEASSDFIAIAYSSYPGSVTSFDSTGDCLESPDSSRQLSLPRVQRGWLKAGTAQSQKAVTARR
ncbi:hypothetical protein AK812_SmicGene1416 [Symbiodinium microadriaticum]|uniref:Uncharacterized protein n=1 Tax=Symbiodinium microadriaticum TaxID=2951 RepID=A0A1Q9F453_SYMMI|nr:hypothetical protein AK812_SmicGene1416 [Symbiodinium microadriaticum]